MTLARRRASRFLRVNQETHTRAITRMMDVNHEPAAGGGAGQSDKEVPWVGWVQAKNGAGFGT